MVASFVAICLLMVMPLYVTRTAIKYQSIAQGLATPNEINYFKNELGKSHNYSELIVWENKHLNFTYEDIQRNSDPIKILEYGKGRCEEFAILYSALCISQGYESRIVFAVFNDHLWNEVKLNGTWTRIDASLNDTSSRAIGYPQFFEREKGWAPPILALAFDNSSVTDVTGTYRSGFWISITSIPMVMFLAAITIWFVFILYFLARRFSLLKQIIRNLRTPAKRGDTGDDVNLTREEAQRVKEAGLSNKI
jgi:hypothetical protein